MATDIGRAAPSLSTRGLTIRFGGHVAVNAVTADFYPGTLTVIVGPNGAGKTTWFNLISGQMRASAGSVHLHGRDITRLGAAQRTRLGIGRAFQLTNLFPLLSVIENVRLAVQSRAGIGLDFFSVCAGHKALDRPRRLLPRTRGAGRAARRCWWARCRTATSASSKWRSCWRCEPSVMMFDEPTAGMSVDDVPVVLDLIHDVKDDADRTVLLVEHKMDVVRQLADRIVVLHNGALVADGKPAEVMASTIVQEAYLGTSDTEHARA